MPHDRKTERVVVVRTDPNGNVLDYDVVEQSGQSGQEGKLALSRQTPRFKKNKTPSEESLKLRNLKNEDGLVSARNPARKKRRRSGRTPRQMGDSTPETPRQRRTSVSISPGRGQSLTPRSPGRIDDATPRTSRRRRVRYVPPQSNVRIFDEKLTNWIADPKIDTQNEDAMKRLHMGVQKKIFHESVRKPNPKPTLDNHNEDAVERMRMGVRPPIFDSKLVWPATSRIDNQNNEYMTHKKRRAQMPEKIFSQSYQQEQKLRSQSLTGSDYFNQDSTRLPPINGEKHHRTRKPQIDQKNDEYIERLRQKRTAPKIFREKLRWRKVFSPRIDNQNPEYLDSLRDDKIRPKVYSELPRWKSQSKIDTFNDMYNPNSYMKPPPIMSEKLRWHAKSRIDTGLEPESDDYYESEGEYDDDNFYEDNEYDYELAN